MNTYKINIDILKSYKDQFNSEIETFKNTSFNNFKNSYLSTNSSYIISTMFKNLSELYNRVESGYDVLYNWFASYLSNAESLELYLSGSSTPGNISESSIRAIIYSKLKELPDYNINYSGLIKK